jgi:hypothetical protein
LSARHGEVKRRFVIWHFVCGKGADSRRRRAAAWPLTARAQQGDRMRRVGVLMDTDESNPIIDAQVAALGPTQLTLAVSRATVRKVIRGHKTEFKYARGVQPAPKLGDWVEVLTEIIADSRADRWAAETVSGR